MSRGDKRKRQSVKQTVRKKKTVDERNRQKERQSVKQTDKEKEMDRQRRK